MYIITCEMKKKINISKRRKPITQKEVICMKQNSGVHLALIGDTGSCVGVSEGKGTFLCKRSELDWFS